MVMKSVNGKLVKIEPIKELTFEGLERKLNKIIDELNYVREFCHSQVWKGK